MIKWSIKRFKHALKGLLHAVINDRSFRWQLYLLLTLGILVRIFARGLTQAEYLFLTIVAALVIITELQNSALEAALDRIHPELHDKIGRSKDMAAAAVLVSGLVLALVFGLVILNQLT